MIHQSMGANLKSVFRVLETTRPEVAITSMTPRSDSEGRGSRRFSRSESSWSSGSGSGSDVGSDASSDGFKVGLDRKSAAQQKFKRLRRIFLNRPTKRKEKQSAPRRRLGPNGAQLGRKSLKSIAERRHSLRHRRCSSSSSSTSEGELVDNPPTVSAGRPLQAVIDQLMTSLWEQMKRHFAQRDSSA
jgi:hypothetical protein